MCGRGFTCPPAFCGQNSAPFVYAPCMRYRVSLRHGAVALEGAGLGAFLADKCQRLQEPRCRRKQD